MDDNDCLKFSFGMNSDESEVGVPPWSLDGGELRWWLEIDDSEVVDDMEPPFCCW